MNFNRIFRIRIPTLIATSIVASIALAAAEPEVEITSPSTAVIRFEAGGFKGTAGAWIYKINEGSAILISGFSDLQDASHIQVDIPGIASPFAGNIVIKPELRDDRFPILIEIRDTNRLLRGYSPLKLSPKLASGDYQVKVRSSISTVVETTVRIKMDGTLWYREPFDDLPVGTALVAGTNVLGMLSFPPNPSPWVDALPAVSVQSALREEGIFPDFPDSILTGDGESGRKTFGAIVHISHDRRVVWVLSATPYRLPCSYVRLNEISIDVKSAKPVPLIRTLGTLRLYEITTETPISSIAIPLQLPSLPPTDLKDNIVHCYSIAENGREGYVKKRMTSFSADDIARLSSTEALPEPAFIFFKDQLVAITSSETNREAYCFSAADLNTHLPAVEIESTVGSPEIHSGDVERQTAATLEDLNFLEGLNVSLEWNDTDETSAPFFGTVRLSKKLVSALQKTLSTYELSTAIKWIMAHEFGHQVQLKVYGAEFGSLPAIERELQADALASVYMFSSSADQLANNPFANRSMQASRAGAMALVREILSVQGVGWNDASTHGTLQQREVSFLNGEWEWREVLKILGPTIAADRVRAESSNPGYEVSMRLRWKLQDFLPWSQKHAKTLVSVGPSSTDEGFSKSMDFAGFGSRAKEVISAAGLSEAIRIRFNRGQRIFSDMTSTQIRSEDFHNSRSQTKQGGLNPQPGLEPIEVLSSRPRGPAEIQLTMPAALRHLEPVPGTIWCLAISHDGSKIAAGCLGAYSAPEGRYNSADTNTSTITIWNCSDGKILNRLVGHEDWIRAVAFDSDGNRLISGSEDGTIRIWNLQTDQVDSLDRIGQANVRCVAFSPDFGRAFYADATSFVVHAQLLGLQREGLRRNGNEENIIALSVSLNGQLLASGGHDGSVRIWDITGRKRDPRLTLDGHSDDVISVTFNSTGSRVLSLSSDGGVSFWDATTGAELKRFDLGSDLLTCAIEPGDSYAVVTDTEGRVWKIDLAAGMKPYRFNRKGSSLFAAAFSAASQIVAVGGADQSVEIYSLSAISRSPETTAVSGR